MLRLRNRWKQLEGSSPLLAFLFGNAAIGSALGVAFAVLLIVVDAGGLRTLIGGSSEPWAPLALLIVGFATLIGGLYTAAAIMLLPKGDD